jgi:hypothetical protein
MPAITTSVYNSEFHVTGRKQSGPMVDTWFDGLWHVQDLGGSIDGTPSVVAYNGQFHIFGSSFGTIYHKWWSGSVWYDWVPLGAGNNPVAVVFNHGGVDQLHVVSRQGNGSVGDIYYDGSAWQTQNLGGSIERTPSVAIYNGQFHIVGSWAGQVYHRWFNGSVWATWSIISTGHEPVATVFTNGGVTELHVTSRHNNGSVIDTFYNGAWYSQNLGGIIQGRPSVAVYNGQFHVFAARLGTVFHKWSNGSTWYNWVPISTGYSPVAAVYNNEGNDELHVMSREGDATVTDTYYNGGAWLTRTLFDFG